uniref:Protein kinase domain-containing protein n=1 Tax=Neobodo designis TaxID=312471 RepID=A0A7S1LYG1_NEODS
MVESMSYDSPAASSFPGSRGASSAVVEDLVEEIDGPATGTGSGSVITLERATDSPEFTIPTIKRLKKGRSNNANSRSGNDSQGSRSISPQRLRVGTPGLGISSRCSSACARSTDAVGINSDIEEERDDVEHILTFKAGGAAAVKSGKSNNAGGGFRVKTFREIRGSERRQFDASCVLLGVGLDGGGHIVAVHRFPMAPDDVNTLDGSGASGTQEQLPPSVVRTMRTRLQQLARLPTCAHVLRVHGAALKEGALFCPSDFAAGGSLVDAITRQHEQDDAAGAPRLQQFPEDFARLVFLHVLRGVRFLHAHGVAHGLLHLRNIFVHEAAGSAHLGVSGSDAGDALLVDDDDDANAAAGLVAALGGFNDAVLNGRVHHRAAGAQASPQQSGAFAIGGRARGARRGFDLTPESTMGREQSSSSAWASEPAPLECGSPVNAVSANHEFGEDFAEDLHALSRLFTALFRGFTAAGEPNDMAGAGADELDIDDDVEEIGAPAAASARENVQPLSPAASAFERTLRQALMSSGPVARRGGASPAVGARAAPANAGPTAAESVDRLDTLLADPFLEPTSVTGALTAMCRKAVAKGRAFRPRAAAGGRSGPPLPVALVQYARRRRRDVVLECMKQRAQADPGSRSANGAPVSGGLAGAHKSFRFAVGGGGGGGAKGARSMLAGNPLDIVEPNRVGAPNHFSRSTLGSHNPQPATARKRDVSPHMAPSVGGPATARRTMAVL